MPFEITELKQADGAILTGNILFALLDREKKNCEEAHKVKETEVKRGKKLRYILGSLSFVIFIVVALVVAYNRCIFTPFILLLFIIPLILGISFFCWERAREKPVGAIGLFSLIIIIISLGFVKADDLIAVSKEWAQSKGIPMEKVHLSAKDSTKPDRPLRDTTTSQ